MRVAFTTFGCKINQCETEEMRTSVAEQGNAIVAFDQDADVYVINTCSVTRRSDSQCRQAIRSAARRGRQAKVVVTGCYAETRPQEILTIPGVTCVLGNREKGRLAAFVGKGTHSGPETRRIPAGTDTSRTRGFMKIQDGCSDRCSYCIVPLARGASRSLPEDALLDRFASLVSSGVPEIVLTGIHIGQYGRDLGPAVTLTGLIRKLVNSRRQARIRLSSIEPLEITDELIDMLGHGVCRHLHIPLQSGDDVILRAMNRHYSAGTYRELVERIAKQVPGIALGADVMVGFPGEDERRFQNTWNLIQDLPLTHLHVFTFSPRPGTKAATMAGQVPDGAKKLRSNILRRCGQDKNLAFRKRMVGSILPVVIEKQEAADGGMRCGGLTDNYLRVQVTIQNHEQFQKSMHVRVKAATAADTLCDYFPTG